MGRTEIISKLESIVKEIFKNDDLKIDENTEIKDLKAWDSLLHMQLIVAMEKEFGIKFKLSEITQLTSVNTMVDIISTKVNNNG